MKMKEWNDSTLYFTQNETLGRGENSSLPPAAPSSGTPSRAPASSNWHVHKSGK